MTDYTTPARVRVAPSPTGHMHLGTARTALYDYLLAKKTGGKFILRVEDTDIKRTIPGAEQEIMDGLRWLGLEYDQLPTSQITPSMRNPKNRDIMPGIDKR